MASTKPTGNQLDIQDIANDISNDSTAISALAAGITSDPGAVAQFDASYLRRDGTNDLTANLDASGFNLVSVNAVLNLVAPVNPTDAANRAYVDASVAGFQPLDADLTALAALGTFGFVSRTAANTFFTRTLVGTSGNITITNPAGVGGDPDFDLLTVGVAVPQAFLKVGIDTKGRVTSSTPVVAGDITALVDTTYVNVTGDTMSGSLVMTGVGTQITLPNAPVALTDAANKAYVDSIIAGTEDHPDWELFTAVGGETMFVVPFVFTAPVGGKAAVQVFLNGIKQTEGVLESFTISPPSTITFNVAVSPGDKIEVYGYG